MKITSFARHKYALLLFATVIFIGAFYKNVIYRINKNVTFSNSADNLPIRPSPPAHLPDSRLSRQPIYVVTPTHGRLTQLADLTSMSQTLRLFENVFWIVVEDSRSTVAAVERLLERSKVPYLYVAQKTTVKKWAKGIDQRNRALTILKQMMTNNSLPFTVASEEISGTVYFADDDNAYSSALFSDCLPNIQNASVWPVGFAGGALLEGPIISLGGRIKSWNTLWRPERVFPIDMAGFAVTLDLIVSKNATFRGDKCILSTSTTILGNNKKIINSPETCFLEDLGLRRTTISTCRSSHTLVWHRKTVDPRQQGHTHGTRMDMDV